MGYQTRSGRRYYYHTKRRGDGFTSTYIGTGPEAEFLAEQIERKRQQRLERIALQKRLDQAERPLIVFGTACHDIYVAYKVSLGFYLHKRQWRKRGAQFMQLPPSVHEIEDQLDQELCRLEFETGDEDALIEKYNANPARTTLNCLLNSMTITGFQKEAYRHQHERMKRELLAGRPESGIEGIMAGRIALDYIDVHYHDRLYYLNITNDMKIAESFDKRRARAARRLTRSIRAFSDLTRSSINDVNNNLNMMKLKVV